MAEVEQLGLLRVLKRNRVKEYHRLGPKKSFPLGTIPGSGDGRCRGRQLAESQELIAGGVTRFPGKRSLKIESPRRSCLQNLINYLAI